MSIKILLAALISVYLINAASAQAVSIVVPGFTNYSISQTCQSGNVGISLQYRSTATVQFQTFDNLFSTCYPATLPQPYSSLSLPLGILGFSFMAARTTTPNLCLSFTNTNSSAATIWYQLAFVCKM